MLPEEGHRLGEGLVGGLLVFEIALHDDVTAHHNLAHGLAVGLDELVDEVGADAIRYFMISRSANSPVEFDLDLAMERSDKNPVYYIQNAHVRCAGIFRKWAEAGLPADADVNATERITLPTPKGASTAQVSFDYSGATGGFWTIDQVSVTSAG